MEARRTEEKTRSGRTHAAGKASRHQDIRKAGREVHLGGLLGLKAQDIPRHIWTEVFASHLALRGALDGWAVLGGDASPGPVQPVPNVLLLYPQR